MPTIRQLAKIAGVAISTVSRALNDQPEVSPETRQRIKELAARYQYRPNNLTQSLITGKTQTLGCVVSKFNSLYYSQVTAGVLEAAFQESYHVMMLQSHGYLENTRLALEMLIQQRVDGAIIVCGHAAKLPTDLMNELWSHQIATVLVDSAQAAREVDSVRTDEMRLAELCVEYLMNLGHREISFVGSFFKELPMARDTAMASVFRHHGLDTRYWINHETATTAELMFEQLLSFPQRPTAVIASSDMIAIEMMQYAHLHGIRIPQDLSIIGCSNTEFSQFVYPALTTVEQYPLEVGKMAVTMALRRIHEGRGNESEIQMIPPRLVERQSCGPRTRKG